MRRSQLLTVAIALVWAAPSIAWATTVLNDRGWASVIDSAWAIETEDSFTGGGAVATSIRGGETSLSYYQYTETWLLCDDGGTPDVPEDDLWGLEFTFETGNGSASMQLDRQFETGSAVATIDIYSTYVNDCAGELVETVREEVRITIRMEATSALIRESGSSVFRIPGQTNEALRSSSSYRYGEGVVEVAGGRIATNGAMGQTSWHFHANG